MTTAKLDPTKPVQCANGCKVTLIQPPDGVETGDLIFGFVHLGCDAYLAQWIEYGHCYGIFKPRTLGHDLHEFRLVNVKPKVRLRMFVNVYSDESFSVHSTRDIADREPHWLHRIACIEIDREVEEGEGL